MAKKKVTNTLQDENTINHGFAEAVNDSKNSSRVDEPPEYDYQKKRSQDKLKKLKSVINTQTADELMQEQIINDLQVLTVNLQKGSEQMLMPKSQKLLMAQKRKTQSVVQGDEERGGLSIEDKKQRDAPSLVRTSSPNHMGKSSKMAGNRVSVVNEIELPRVSSNKKLNQSTFNDGQVNILDQQPSSVPGLIKKKTSLTKRSTV